jgi:hypothetical protein
MESICALETRHSIQARNLAVVGWYHSRPVCTPNLTEFQTHYRSESWARGNCPSFDTITSALDNISSAQEINDSSSSNRTTLCSPETPLPQGPFVGAILSPYDSTPPTPHTSPIDWFSIGNDGETQNQLMYDLHKDTGLSIEEETRLVSTFDDTTYSSSCLYSLLL